MASPGSPPPEETFHRALRLHEQGDSAEAERLLSSLIRSTPGYEDAYEALSVMLYNLRRFEDAIAVIRAWIRINPDSVMARTNLSRCFVEKGMIAEAEREQAEARRLGWKAELAAGKKAMPADDTAERIERFKEVIAMDPADVLGYFSLGSAYLEAGMKREALDTFENAVRVDPDHSSSWLGFGQALEALGDANRAVEAYRRGIETAGRRGDMIPLRKMEARIRALGEPGDGKD